MAAERIPQTTTYRCAFQMFLSTDHVTDATGKTVAITISKNGAAYGNPSGGATNATEVASGTYYVDLTTTDTATLGPLVVLGTAASCDNLHLVLDVVKATTGGLTALPDTAVTTNASLITSGSGTDQLHVATGIAYADLQTIKTQTVTCGAGVSIDPFVGNATAFLSVDASGRAKIQSGMYINTAFAGFVFQMTDSTTHAPKTGLTVTSQVSIDGAALVAATNSAAEISNGLYKINLAAADLNCTKDVMLRFTSAGADDVNIFLVPQP